MTPAEKTRMLAERVMGWRAHFRNTALYVPMEQEHSAGALTVTARVSDWSPLTNLSHAGEVMEAMRAKGWLIHILIQPDTNVVHLMEVKGAGHFATDDEVLPTAICHAALLAEGVKEEEL
jgi:hypothetical protein